MSEMIELVARSIHDSMFVERFDDLPANSIERAGAIQQARDAIVMMREFTEDMYRAADALASASEGPGPDRIWHAMIDAALK